MDLMRRRVFLLENMPAPLTRASEHVQFFDNYLTETRLLLRKMRTPQTRQWTWKIVQQYAVNPQDLSELAVAEIELNEREYEVFSIFEANELRYNRYFFKHENRFLAIDMYLNRELWNLILATVEFEHFENPADFSAPPFAVAEVTQDDFFSGARLIESNLEDIRKHLAG